MSFFGLEIGKRSLMSQQAALTVVGQNIANANTVGYSRQIVNLEAQSMYSEKYGTVGTGVDLASVNRARNEFLDDRMIKELSEQSKWELRELNIESIQYVFNEPNDGTIRDSLDQFWSAMQDLSQNAQESSTRETVIEKTKDLTAVIKSAYDQMSALRTSMNDSVKVEVSTVNSNIKKIADLNGQIERLERDGVTKANDLRDERDRVAEELAKSINMKVTRDTGGYSVVIDGRTVVQGSNYQTMKLNGDGIPGAMYEVAWEDTGAGVGITNGKLKAMIELRDEDTVKYMEYLDQMAIGIIDTINDANSAGFDINGQKGDKFFIPFETTEEIVTLSGNTQTAIYKIHGDTVVKNAEDAAVKNSSITGGTGEIEINRVRISYNTSVDSINDIITRINNADTGVVAGLDANNRLVFRGDRESEYNIREIKQTNGTLLEELGIFQAGATQFNYKNAATLANISTNRMAIPKSGAGGRIEVFITDVDKIAAAKGKDIDGDGIADVSLGVGNGENALAMAKIKHKNMIGNYTADDYFKTLISDLAVTGAQASTAYKNQVIVTTSVEQRRQSEIGVSPDEELTDMIKYQHAYSAAAKYISTVDEMLDTIINKL